MDTALTPIRIGPDLIVAAASVPGSAAVGTTITVTDTTMNQGGDVAGASTTRFYLSVNAVPDGGDVVLGSRSVPALVPGTTSAEATALTIPAGTPVGGYYFIVEADATDAVAETFEWNNTSLRWIEITSSP